MHSLEPEGRLARAAGAIAHASKLGLSWEAEGRPSAAFFLSLT